MSKPDHGAIEWSPVEWEGFYKDLRIRVWRQYGLATWAFSVSTVSKNGVGREGKEDGGFPDVTTAQRAAANWFIDWQRSNRSDK